MFYKGEPLSLLSPKLSQQEGVRLTLTTCCQQDNKLDKLRSPKMDQYWQSNAPEIWLPKTWSNFERNQSSRGGARTQSSGGSHVFVFVLNVFLTLIVSFPSFLCFSLYIICGE